MARKGLHTGFFGIAGMKLTPPVRYLILETCCFIYSITSPAVIGFEDTIYALGTSSPSLYENKLVLLDNCDKKISKVKKTLHSYADYRGIDDIWMLQQHGLKLCGRNLISADFN
jgi:hypothetical protein